MVRFGESDVVRHPLVTRMVGAYNARDARRRKAAERKLAAKDSKSETGSDDQQ